MNKSNPIRQIAYFVPDVRAAAASHAALGFDGGEPIREIQFASSGDLPKTGVVSGPGLIDT